MADAIATQGVTVTTPDGRTVEQVRDELTGLIDTFEKEHPEFPELFRAKITAHSFAVLYYLIKQDEFPQGNRKQEITRAAKAFCSYFPRTFPSEEKAVAFIEERSATEFIEKDNSSIKADAVEFDPWMQLREQVNTLTSDDIHCPAAFSKFVMKALGDLQIVLSGSPCTSKDVSHNCKASEILEIMKQKFIATSSKPCHSAALQEENRRTAKGRFTRTTLKPHNHIDDSFQEEQKAPKLRCFSCKSYKKKGKGRQRFDSQTSSKRYEASSGDSRWGACSKGNSCVKRQ
ncbi:MAG: hypothetical protein ABW189_00005 [Rickettsiales bacterium]